MKFIVLSLSFVSSGNSLPLQKENRLKEKTLLQIILVAGSEITLYEDDILSFFPRSLDILW